MYVPQSVYAYVHIYVGVYCLTSPYLPRRVSSHVPFCTSLQNALYGHQLLFVCAHNGAVACYLCVAVWIGPLCVVSDLNFMAG